MKKCVQDSPYRRRAKNLPSLERGRHHLIVRQQASCDGIAVRWPILYVVYTDDIGDVRIHRLAPLLDYFADHSARSYRWMKNVARAIGALIDHSTSIALSSDFNEWKKAGMVERKLLRGLAHSLLKGTVRQGPDGRFEDPTGLYWRGLGKKQAGVLLSALTLFFRWLRDEPYGEDWARGASTDAIRNHPMIAFRLASELIVRRQNSLLGHLSGQAREPSHAFPFIVQQSAPSTGAVPTFPAKYVGPMLYKGFENGRGGCDETAQLLTHLIFLFGIRKSESFHLFASDVQFSAGTFWVFFHHPEYGKVMVGGEHVTRQEYLRRFGLAPRNRIEGPNKAGWKGMADELQGAVGYALPIPVLFKRTMSLLRHYIFNTRPAIMALRPRSLPDHPFLFVSTGRAAGVGGVAVGDPYTMSAYEEAWGRAIPRIGKMFDDPSMMKPRKANGTTPHGARHFFGRFLFSAGVEGPIIQRCLHHKTLEAYKVYTRLTPGEIDQILRNANEDISSNGGPTEMRDGFLSQLQMTPPF
jgi:hypothetical protein